MCERKRPQDDAVDEREDGRVAAARQCQQRACTEDEPWPLPAATPCREQVRGDVSHTGNYLSGADANQSHYFHTNHEICSWQMTGVDLRHLRLVAELHATGSATLAADRLGITQSAV